MSMDFGAITEQIKEAFTKLTSGEYSLDDIMKGNKIWEGLDFQQKGTVGEMIAAAVKSGKIPGVGVAGENKAGDRTYKVEK